MAIHTSFLILPMTLIPILAATAWTLVIPMSNPYLMDFAILIHEVYLLNIIRIMRGRYLERKLTVPILIGWTNFHSGEKAKAMRLQLPTIYNIHLLFFVFKVQGDDGQLPTNPSVTPALRNYYVQNSFAQGD